MPRRSRARAIVLQALYRADFDSEADVLSDDEFLNRRLLKNEQLVEFASQLLAGVLKERDAIDRRLEAAAKNWRLDRMAATDRNVLRLGIYELLHTDTPRAVVINECVELAKQFGTGKSAKFVNGILDQVNESDPEPPAKPESDDSNPTEASEAPAATESES